MALVNVAVKGVFLLGMGSLCTQSINYGISTGVIQKRALETIQSRRSFPMTEFGG